LFYKRDLYSADLLHFCHKMLIRKQNWMHYRKSKIFMNICTENKITWECWLVCFEMETIFSADSRNIFYFILYDQSFFFLSLQKSFFSHFCHALDSATEWAQLWLIMHCFLQFVLLFYWLILTAFNYNLDS